MVFINPSSLSSQIAAERAAIDAAAAGTGFACTPVSWQDVQRAATATGVLSCGGKNIADVYGVERTENDDAQTRPIYVVRTNNWNERLATVDARQVSVVQRGTATQAPRPMTLYEMLRDFGAHAAYVGCERDVSLLSEERDSTVTMRFQTVFLRAANTAGGVDAQQKTEFATEVYSYQTRDARDPRNMLVLCTAQGFSVQQDTVGRGRVYHHEIDDAGRAQCYWLEAEASRFAVGGAQEESAAEAAAAVARGRTAANYVGIEAMGRRFNVQMLVQVPLKQAGASTCFEDDDDDDDDDDDGGGGGDLMAVTESCVSFGAKGTVFNAVPVYSGGASRAATAVKSPPQVGTSTAARVSRGTHAGSMSNILNTRPVRDTSQHVTVTVTTYQTVEGGVPSAADVKAAIADLFALYAACTTDRRLQDIAHAQIVAQQSSGIVYTPSAAAVAVAAFTPATTPAPPVGLAFPRATVAATTV